MRLLTFVSCAALLVLTAALPRPRSLGIPIYKRSTPKKDGVFDLKAAQSHVEFVGRKYRHGMTALKCHTGGSSSCLRTRPPHSHTARDAISLTDAGNTRWYGTLSVGTPPVEYKMDFDTGSADLFLPASNCDSTCAGHTLYNPNASSSSVDLHKTFALSFGDGSAVVGEQHTDTVTIGGFVATSQTIGAASEYSPGFQINKAASDGLIGLGFPSISVFQENPVIQTLIADNQLPEPVFAFFLASSGSELTIGGTDSNIYKGSFTYAPVTEQGFWKIGVDSVDVNGQAVSNNPLAVLDTGTSFILGDSKIVDAFYSSINATNVGSGFYTMPCDAMPNVSFTISGKAIGLSADTFNLGSYDSSGTSCIGAIAGTGSLGDTWILGDVFLRNVYTVFDVGNTRVGFADLA